MPSKKPAPKRKRPSTAGEDALASYRRLRKPMPPPDRVIADKRRKLEEREARREVEEDEP